ncbi:MAG: molybdopterin dinucleotide binding domain-containing protein [Promethearchaeota archaeon]
MKMIVNTVRMVDYDQLREFMAGDNDSLKENLAIGLFNPRDMEKLKLTEKSNVKLSSKFGQITVNVRQKEDVPNGIIIMPVSIWSNQITGVENGELIFKNIEVNVELTQEPILSFEDIISSIKVT